LAGRPLFEMAVPLDLQVGLSLERPQIQTNKFIPDIALPKQFLKVIRDTDKKGKIFIQLG
jgi:hypothetical protein